MGCYLINSLSIRTTLFLTKINYISYTEPIYCTLQSLVHLMVTYSEIYTTGTAVQWCPVSCAFVASVTSKFDLDRQRTTFFAMAWPKHVEVTWGRVWTAWRMIQNLSTKVLQTTHCLCKDFMVHHRVIVSNKRLMPFPCPRFTSLWVIWATCTKWTLRELDVPFCLSLPACMFKF
jgi:hypothetical protein